MTKTILLLLLLLLLLSPAAAAADDERLALAVARVAVHEAGFDSPADVALVWQVVEGRARTADQRLAWLHRHSARVAGERQARSTRTLWARQLSPSGARPWSWPADASWSRYRDRWLRVLRLARSLVTGHERRRPCPQQPLTWGGPMDREQAAARGLVPCGCVGTLNEGYR